MKIKNGVHAIDLTIERHQAVLDGKYGSYNRAKGGMIPDDWVHHCPLCVYYDWDCDKCLWTKYEGATCVDSEINYSKDKESIIRLKEWRELELKELNQKEAL